MRRASSFLPALLATAVWAAPTSANDLAKSDRGIGKEPAGHAAHRQAGASALRTC